MSTEFRRLAMALEVSNALKTAGSWCGETHIQKASYLLAELEDVNPGWEFVLYKHGPYSFDLHDDLVSAQAMGLLVQRAKPPYGPSLEVSEDGLRLLEQFSASQQDAKRKAAFLAGRIGPKNVFELEKLATAVYISEQERGSTEQKRSEKLRELKPHVTESAALQAIAEADELIRETTAVQVGTNPRTAGPLTA